MMNETLFQNLFSVWVITNLNVGPPKSNTFYATSFLILVSEENLKFFEVFKSEMYGRLLYQESD
jgi:hypothetical protein